MTNIADELKKLSELREAGALTADEYLEAKALALSGRRQLPPPPPADVMRTNYGPATAAFWLGVAAIPFAWVGVVPIVAVVTSVCAMVGFDDDRHKNWWMAPTGMLLGLLGVLAMLYHYKHI